MAKSINQKAKLLYLNKILEEKTDDNNALSMKDLIAELEKHDIKAERKSLYDDINVLNDFGLEIIFDRKDGGYKLLSRKFDIPEIKLLIDAVQASKFITEKKSNSLIKKLEETLSEHQAKEIQHTVVMHQRIKSMNETVYYGVDTIHKAITDKRKISFLYYNMNMQKQKVYRHEGKEYVFSPIALVWDDENYYLLAQGDDDDTIKHFRVDKMEKINILKEKSICREDRFDTAKFSKKVFGMYGGKTVGVKLRVHESLVGVFLDRFGQNLIITPEGHYFTTIIEVEESPVFFGWIMQFGNRVQILGPSSIVNEMKENLNQIADLYK